MWFQNFYDTFYKCFIKEDRYQLLLDGIGVTVKVSLLAVVFSERKTLSFSCFSY